MLKTPRYWPAAPPELPPDCVALPPDWLPDCEPPERCIEPPVDWLPFCEPPERFMEPEDEPCEVEDEPWPRPTVEDEPLVFCRERTVFVRVVSRERTLARTFTSPPERFLTTVRLDSPLIATLGCRFFLMMVVRLAGSAATTLLRCFFLITTFEGRLSTATT